MTNLICSLQLRLNISLYCNLLRRVQWNFQRLHQDVQISPILNRRHEKQAGTDLNQIESRILLLNIPRSFHEGRRRSSATEGARLRLPASEDPQQRIGI